MLECLVLGDSIGVGLSKQLTECHSLSIGGYNTWQWNKRFPNEDINKPFVIISLGTNDHKYIKTKKELQQIRARITTGRVVWILPYSNLKASEVNIATIQQYITEIAQEHHDIVLPIPSISADNIHPSDKGYKTLSQNTRSFMNSKSSQTPQ